MSTTNEENLAGSARQPAGDPEFDNSGAGPIRVPGFGVRPAYELPPHRRFAHGMFDWELDWHVTAREIAMLQAMDAVTDKPSWDRHVLDSDSADAVATTAEWRAEADQRHGFLISDRAWEWCLEELRDKAATYRRTGMVGVLDAGSRLCKADLGSAGEEICAALAGAARDLMAGGCGGDGGEAQVVDVLDPSLYPLVFGKTKVLSDGGTVPLDSFVSSFGKGSAETRIPERTSPRRRRRQSPSRRASTKFQWLPCEVEHAGSEGPDAAPKITSYINNLHPVRYKGLYGIFEKLIGAALEPWNQVLVQAMPEGAEDTDYGGTRAAKVGVVPVRIRTYGVEWPQNPKLWIPLLEEFGENAESDAIKQFEEALAAWGRGPRWPKWTDQQLNRVEAKWEIFKRFLHPEPGVSFTFEDWKAGRTAAAVVPKKIWDTPPSEPPSDIKPIQQHLFYATSLQRTLRDQGLQVVIQVRSIELTPQKPRYDPGPLRNIPGFLNEHIAATAVLCFETYNATEFRIEFRQRVVMPYREVADADNEEHMALMEVFAIPYDPREEYYLQGQKMVQTLGSVAAARNRLIAYPSTLDTRPLSVELVDATRPGWVRFAVLRLVDPNYRVCSTRNVPPQRHDWWAEAVAGLDLWEKKDIPPELVDQILDETKGSSISKDEAERIRSEINSDRDGLSERLDEEIYTFNFEYNNW